MRLAAQPVPVGFCEGLQPRRPRPVWLQGEIALRKVSFNGGNQFFDAGKAAFTNAINGEVSKKSFHHIHPRTACWDEVHVEPWSFCQPSLHLGMFVGAVVVNDEMKVEMGGCPTINLFEKAQPPG